MTPDPQPSVSSSQLLEKIALYKVQGRFNALRFFKPYPYQLKFIAESLENAQVALIAGDRVGKSFGGGRIGAMHLTGDYPQWWKGRRFPGPIKMWACGVTNDKVREVSQTQLCGDAEDPLQ